MNEGFQKALYWQPHPDQTAECLLCPHHCRIKPGNSGRCQARKNLDGCLAAWNYGKITSLSLDPIEKKPLQRFFPGTWILSAGSFGCNFHCGFCQNWEISQQVAPYQSIMPDELVKLATQAVPQGNIGLAYTYNEPLVGFEYVLECAQQARMANLKNVLVTNGYINPEPLQELIPWIDALNIDLKSWNQDFYGKICGGQVEVVKQTIALCAAACHVEVTTLLLPGQNDSEKEIREISSWLASISRDIPLHLNRHHPDYLMPDPPPISLIRLQLLADIARRELKDVFTGNK